MLLCNVALTFAWAHVCLSWGSFGHQISGSIASYFLTSKANQTVVDLLQDLSRESTWADRIKSLGQYHWANHLHYVNPHDNEPDKCSFLSERDCPYGDCVTGAIRNYTLQLLKPSFRDQNQSVPRDQSMQSFSKHHHHDHPEYQLSDRQIAIRFLAHYVEDVHQPLHASGRSRGGNGSPVLFDGRKTNLHVVFDSKILEKSLRNNFKSSYSKYLKYFIDQIKENKWEVATCNGSVLKSRDFSQMLASNASVPQDASSDNLHFVERKHATRKHGQVILSSSKTQSITPNQFFPLPKSIATAVCPDMWAKEANALDCAFVYRAFTENEECGGQYYLQNLPVVEMQIAKSGLRLAHALNILFDNQEEAGNNSK